MKFILKRVFVCLGLIVVWAVTLFFGTLEGWWYEPFADPHTDDFFKEAVLEIRNAEVGSIAMAIINGGIIEDEYFFSLDHSVDGNTAFQVASLSKWVTAWGVMALVEQERLDLDKPITEYLTRWTLPESEYDNRKVTARLLLSHTAGLTDGLGYAGFPPGTPVQSLEASLTNAADASPGANGSVTVGVEPGTKWIYSGGGYTLLQLVIEEVSGKSFQDYMQETVFTPLGMTNSTFIWDDVKNDNLAKFYDRNGLVTRHLRYTSLAATSLYTSLHDMALFVGAHFEGAHKEPRGRGVIQGKTIDSIKVPHAYQMGAAIWGLGAMLYASNNQNDYVIGHDGKNEPAINTAVRLDPSTKEAIIILEMGHPTLATKIGSEWVFWKTGNVDTLLFLSLIEPMFKWFWVGSLIIVLLGSLFYFLHKKRHHLIK